MQSRGPYPKRDSAGHIRPKVLVIGKERTFKMLPEEKTSSRRTHQLAIDKLLSKTVQDDPLAQFVDSFYRNAGLSPNTVLNSGALKHAGWL
ncbi:hypothetical protein [Ottowia thiooxydans]|uniref:hypothetical protein n=1 Tax=Ottowia thiooxydans TaxID=219182 RepID=UPI000404428B|nr:hypothetical protein [Ottowia thiooxydans]